MTKDIDIQPTFPPTAKLNQTSSIKIFLSTLIVSIGFLLAKPLSFIFFPQPKVPWPKRKSNSTGEGLESPLLGTLTIVTGANSGVGLSIAKAHYQKGSKVILACRNESRGKEAIKCILRESGQNQQELERLQLHILDTCSLDSVRKFVEKWKETFGNEKIDYLFLNAGVAQKPDNEERFTKDGFEYMYQANFLGHFLLTGLLSSSFSDQIRIILTSSHGAITGKFDPNLSLQQKMKGKEEVNFHVCELPFYLYLVSKLFLSMNFLTRYGQTKSMQIVFSNILQQKFDQHSSPKQRRFSASFHPGFVATNIFKTFIGENQKTLLQIAQAIVNFFAVTPDEGCKTGLWLAHTFDAKPGAFFDLDYELALPWYREINDDLMKRLWTRWNNDAGLSENDWKF